MRTETNFYREEGIKCTTITYFFDENTDRTTDMKLEHEFFFDATDNLYHLHTSLKSSSKEMALFLIDTILLGSDAKYCSKYF